VTRDGRSRPNTPAWEGVSGRSSPDIRERKTSQLTDFEFVFLIKFKLLVAGMNIASLRDKDMAEGDADSAALLSRPQNRETQAGSYGVGQQYRRAGERTQPR
jgi:hypothetical protein